MKTILSALLALSVVAGVATVGAVSGSTSFGIVSRAFAEPPPAVRKLPPLPRPGESVEEVRDRATSLITAVQDFLHAVGEDISDQSRREISSAAESLKAALNSGNAPDIMARTDALSRASGLLSHSRAHIDTVNKLLSEVGKGLSESLRRQADDAIVALRQAMKAGDERAIRAKDEALLDISWRNLSGAMEVLSLAEKYLKRLGDDLGFSLRAQALKNVESIREALRGDNWNEVGNRAEPFRELLSSLALAEGELTRATAVLEQLGPSEQRTMLNAIVELKTALRGESWEQVRSKAFAVNEVQHRFEIVAGSGWASCVRILSIDGGGVRGIIPAVILAELERRTGKSISS